MAMTLQEQRDLRQVLIDLARAQIRSREWAALVETLKKLGYGWKKETPQ
jgi:hypothetical protein